MGVVYSASNNELVRTQTLVKCAIFQLDAAPVKQWYLQHYGVEIGRKKKAGAKEGEERIRDFLRMVICWLTKMELELSLRMKLKFEEQMELLTENADGEASERELEEIRSSFYRDFFNALRNNFIFSFFNCFAGQYM